MLLLWKWHTADIGALHHVTFSKNFNCTFLLLCELHKGRVHKWKSGKSLVFCQTPLGPPPLVWHLFKKIYPYFFLKIASLMAETNFTLGPTSKTNKFPLLFLVIVGQNSQHKRANLNGRTPLDIYSNNFRPSVKHVLGVLEWFLIGLLELWSGHPQGCWLSPSSHLQSSD